MSLQFRGSRSFSYNPDFFLFFSLTHSLSLSKSALKFPLTLYIYEIMTFHFEVWVGFLCALKKLLLMSHSEGPDTACFIRRQNSW